MAKRVVPEFRNLSFSLSGVPKELSDDVITRIVEAAVKESAKAVVAAPAAVAPVATIRVPKLRNRNTRKAGTLACTYTEVIGGNKIVGCGRTFTRAATLAAHMDHVSGIWADTVRFPHFCLDAIVTPDLRDDR